MSEVADRSKILTGYLTWCYILGIFLIPISMAITTTDRLQKMTDWTHGYSMILGAIIGIVLTLVLAVLFEYKSR